jgi:hypothetical protein
MKPSAPRLAALQSEPVVSKNHGGARVAARLERGDTVQALREAIADMEAGDTGVPLDQFDQEFRARHDIGRMP